MHASARPTLPFVLVFLAFAASACAKDPSKDVAAARVSEPAAAPSPAEPAAAPVAAAAAEPAAAPVAAPVAAPGAAAAPAPAALPLAGSVFFTGSKVTGSHLCEFKQWTGTVTLVDGKAEGGAFDFTVQTASVEADVGTRNDWTGKLETHLKSDEFFDVAKFPTATFTSSAITAGGENGASHTVRGNLTMRGTTKEVTFPATIAAVGKDVTGKAEFSINRKDFGIVYTGKADDLIRDGVVLRIEAKATLP